MRSAVPPLLLLLPSAALGGGAAGLKAFAHARGGSGASARQQGSRRLATGPDWAASGDAGGYSIESLDASGGTVGRTPPLHFADDALMPGCNAGVDVERGLYFKTTTRVVTMQPARPDADCSCAKPGVSVCCRDPTVPADRGHCYKGASCADIPAGAGQGGGVLTIDAGSGRVTRDVAMSGEVVHPPFGAYNPADGKVYSVVPTEYTSYTLVAIDPLTGNVSGLATYPKGQLDGIALCAGRVVDGELLYVMSSGRDDTVNAISLATKQARVAMKGFYAPLAADPTDPTGKELIAVRNTHPGIALYRISPLDPATAPRLLFALPNTSLGADLRAQDQASLAVDPKGGTAWVQASYNFKNGSLARGLFAVDLHAGRLLHQRALFADNFGDFLGRLDYF